MGIKRTSYWGMVAFSVTMILAHLFGAAASGSQAGNAVAAMWAFAAWYGFKGNADAVRLTSIVAISIQVVLGGLFFLYTYDDPVWQVQYGPPEVLAISLAIPALLWVVLYFWANSYVCNSQASGVKPPPKPLDVSPLPIMGRTLQPLTPLDKVKAEADRIPHSDPPNETRPMKPENHGSTPPGDNVGGSPKHRNAALIIEYSASAATAWKNVCELPEDYRERFRSSLDKSSSEKAEGIAAELIQEHHEKLNPYQCEQANAALHQARTISRAAEEEFRRAYELVGGDTPPVDILAKVERKYGLSEASRQREVAQKEAERLESARVEAERREAERREFERQDAERMAAEQREKGQNDFELRPDAEHVAVRLNFKAANIQGIAEQAGRPPKLEITNLSNENSVVRQGAAQEFIATFSINAAKWLLRFFLLHPAGLSIILLGLMLILALLV